MIDINRAKQRM
jgi:hypothetical protein